MSRLHSPTIPETPRPAVIVAASEPVTTEMVATLWGAGFAIRQVDTSESLQDALFFPERQGRRRARLVIADVRLLTPATRTMLWLMQETGTPVLFVDSRPTQAPMAGGFVLRGTVRAACVTRLARSLLEGEAAFVAHDERPIPANDVLPFEQG